MSLGRRQTKQEHRSDLGIALSCFRIIELVRRRTLCHGKTEQVAMTRYVIMFLVGYLDWLRLLACCLAK